MLVGHMTNCTNMELNVTVKCSSAHLKSMRLHDIFNNSIMLLLKRNRFIGKPLTHSFCQASDTKTS